MADWIDQISELRRLKNEGALSDEEFETHRRAIMAKRASATTESDRPAQIVESQSPKHQQDIEPSTSSDSLAIESGANLRDSEIPAGTTSHARHDSRGAAEASRNSSPHRGRVVFTRLDPQLILLSGSLVIVLCAAAFAYRFFAHPATVAARSPDASAQRESSSMLPPTGVSAQASPTPVPGAPKEPLISQAGKTAVSSTLRNTERNGSSTNTLVRPRGPNVDADNVEGDNPGLQALRAGDLNLAIRLFTNAIESGQLARSDLKLVYVERGNTYLRKNEPDHARNDADQALEIDPNAEDARKLWYATTVMAAPGHSNAISPAAVKWACSRDDSPGGSNQIILFINLEKKNVQSPNFGEVGRKLPIKIINVTASWHFHIEGTQSSNGAAWHSDGLEMFNLNSGTLDNYVHLSSGGNIHQTFHCLTQ